MFGFLSPERSSDEYRAVYSRCCQHQRLHHGLRSLPFLSYEAIFLYRYWLDATGVDANQLPEQRCCRLRTLEDGDLFDAEIGRFCGAVSLLLAGTKIEDDLRDTRSLRTRIAQRLLGRQVLDARRYFASLDHAFDETVEGHIHEHLQMERDGDGVPTSLDAYVGPTANAFGNLFGLLRHLPGMQSHGPVLADMGRHVGSALIAFDCAVDWKQDRATGAFNPLADADAVKMAVRYSKAQLNDASELAGSACGRASGSAALLRSVADSIDEGREQQGSPVFHLRFAQTLALLGVGTGVAAAQTTTQKNDGAGACCCMVICCAMAAAAGKKSIDSIGVTTRDGCGNRNTTTYRPEAKKGC